MERFGGLKKEGRRFGKAGAAAIGDKCSAAPVKGKFKLRTKDPLPQLTKKQPNQETKPKAKFLMSAGTSTATEKSTAKLSGFAANSFMRPAATGNPPKKTTGFSFMKFQSKSTELGKTTDDFSAKSTFPGSKPLPGKFSINVPTKKKSKTTSGTGAKDKETLLFKTQAKGTAPFAFGAETKSSAAKKRKVAGLFHQDKKTAFPSKTGRTNSSFMLKNPALKEDTEKQSGACAENLKAIGSSTSFATKMGAMKTTVNDATVLKKRGLLAGAAPASKRCKTQDVRGLGNPNKMTNRVIKSGTSSGDACREKEDSGVIAPLVLLALKPASTSQDPVADVELSAVAPSPDCREDCLSGVEEELAVNLLCTVDDDNEDEFLTRVATIEEFTDRVGQEQKQLHKRLLDAHADVSECLLDALTDLMVEEGGIGIDKLDFDMNINVDVGDAFLQDDEIQVFQ
ncbi:hypothetical protein F442_08804 [Phytophthora nicotianae P10297]|uniref:Uncharacterized protein n=1 Tax=Phytophthora nicotianae P10297 TaxID=1317064 RepID=W2ZC18_PHYNI|nr:hypothetical protein F442_08804 [Phytophthora nicotianae P10297]